MKILRIQKKSLSETIAQQLRRSILAGQPRPGEKLPPERELAESLGTNRNTLREAIRSLESLGLVSVRQGDGVRVTDFREEAQLNLLPMFLLENPRLQETITVLEDVLYLRRSLLALAVRRMADRPEARARASVELRELFERQREPGRTPEQMLKTDLEFFSCLSRGTGSVVMRWLFNSVVPIYDQILERFPQIWIVPEGYLDFLEAVVRAVEECRFADAAFAIEGYFEAIDPMILQIASQMAADLEQPLGELLAMEL